MNIQEYVRPAVQNEEDPLTEAWREAHWESLNRKHSFWSNLTPGEQIMYGAAGIGFLIILGVLVYVAVTSRNHG